MIREILVQLAGRRLPRLCAIFPGKGSVLRRFGRSRTVPLHSVGETDGHEKSLERLARNCSRPVSAAEPYTLDSGRSGLSLSGCTSACTAPSIRALREKRKIQIVVDCLCQEFYKRLPSSPMRAHHTISKHSPATMWLRRTGMLCSVAAIGFGQPSCANEDLTKEASR